MRLTLTDGSGSTSYWVTTGPAFHFTTRLGMLKLASLPTMIAALRSWSMPRSELAGGDVLEQRQRRQAVLARRARHAAGRVRRRLVAVPHADRARRLAVGGARPAPARRRGDSARRGPSRHRRRPTRPGRGPGAASGSPGRGCRFAGRRGRCGRPARLSGRGAGVLAPRARRRRPSPAASAAGVARRSARSPCAPRPTGATSVAHGPIDARSTTPTTQQPEQHDERPGLADQARQRAGDGAADPAAAAALDEAGASRAGSMMPEQRRRRRAVAADDQPGPSPAADPSPARRRRPAPISRNGSSQRPEPNHGAITFRIQSVRAPLPGSSRPTSIDHAQHQQDDCRRWSGSRPALRRGSDGPPRRSCRAAAARSAGGVRRRVAT